MASFLSKLKTVKFLHHAVINLPLNCLRCDHFHGEMEPGSVRSNSLRCSTPVPSEYPSPWVSCMTLDPLAPWVSRPFNANDLAFPSLDRFSRPYLIGLTELRALWDWTEQNKTMLCLSLQFHRDKALSLLGVENRALEVHAV